VIRDARRSAVRRAADRMTVSMRTETLPLWPH
jgi:hypothetical protein